MMATIHSNVAVFAIPIGADSNDLVHHTLRHFVCDPGFDDLPPTSSLSRSGARWLLIEETDLTEAEIDALPRSGEVSLSKEWWSAPRQSVVERIHDEGYWPRYLAVLAAAPLPGQQGWRQRGRVHIFTSPRRAVITVSWRARRRELWVESALRRLTAHSPRAVSEDDPIYRFLKKRRR